ncbi:MAG TPA: tetratricopeptide repeat protein [Bryobacteraceae bacterium]|jgi:tetratricopeptide (TPR) repeat protein|nr:tetratricopeptide repeat protein [Bryobacteraceae bacterium]
MRAPAGHIAFGPFHLETEVPRLLRDGAELELRPQALHALRTLAQNSGHCVDYAAMIGEAWHGVSVSRHTVAVTVGEVKKALREYGRWISYHPKLGYRLDIPRSEDLIRNGWHYWQRHTREGFDKALACFHEVAGASSTDFRAWEGISRCYLMLATFAMRRPREMYAAFLDSHRRAVDLAGMTPELRGDRAQGLHVFELKFAEAEAELLKAREENPRTAGVHIRLAVLYASTHRTDEALDILAEAYAADALWPILPAAEILVRCCRGEFDQAVACGKKALDLHPYFALGRSHYAQALEFSGRIEEALEHYHLASLMNPDFPRLRAEEARCLARAGRRPEAITILKDLEKLRETEYVDGYPMAFLYDALGEKERAFAELERAAGENSPALFMLDVDPRMEGLRSSARFTRLRNRLFRALPSVTEIQSRPRAVIAPYTPKEPSRTHRAAS